MQQLFKIGDKVRLRYTKAYDDITYIITGKPVLSIHTNTYIIESLDMTPIKEIYIDEIYLVYDKKYLRHLKLNQLIGDYR